MNTAKTETPHQVSHIKPDRKAADALVWAAHKGIVDPSKQLIKCDLITACWGH